MEIHELKLHYHLPLVKDKTSLALKWMENQRDCKPSSTMIFFVSWLIIVLKKIKNS